MGAKLWGNLLPTFSPEGDTNDFVPPTFARHKVNLLSYRILVVNSKNCQALGAPPPDSLLGSMTKMTEECTRPYSEWTCMVYADTR